MNLLLAKIYLLFSLMLGVIVGPSYIQVEAENLSFNFNTGGSYPIIKYLNVKNVGLQKARFDISSNVFWADVFKEGDTGATSVELSEQVAVNFVLQINAQYVKDGINNAEITLNAVDLTSQAQTVLDTKKINVVLNKNVVSPSPSPSPSSSVVTATEPPVATSIITTTPIPQPSPEATAGEAVSTAKTAPTPSPRQIPARAIKPMPTSAPSVNGTPAQLRTVVTPQPTTSISVKPQSPKKATLLKSFWNFFRNLFF